MIKKSKYPPKCMPPGITSEDFRALQRLFPWCLTRNQWLFYRGKEYPLPYNLVELAEISELGMPFIEKMITLGIIYKAGDIADGPIYAISTDYIMVENYLSPIDAVAEAERIVEGR